MNTNYTAQIVTARQLHADVSWPNACPRHSAAWRLLLTQYPPHTALGDMGHRTVRIPEATLLELVRIDQRDAENLGYHTPAVEIMRQGIREGLSASPHGNGNRFRRRQGALNMGARRKFRNAKGRDTVDTYCPDSVPAAPSAVHHLNCA